MKKIILSIALVLLGGIMVIAPAFAGASCVQTSILSNTKCKENEEGILKEDASGNINCKCDDGKGSSVTDTLNLIVNIMTIGIGILGVIGITIVGVQYLTAGGSEEKTRKAKRRMFEIVVGLVAYALIYAALKWLMPNM